MSALTASRAPARRRRRHGGVTLLLVVAVVLGLLVAADRAAKYYVDRTVASKLAGHSPFTTAPQVDAQGFPFLTQALAGNYRSVRVSGSGLTFGSVTGVSFDSTLHGVRVPLSAAVHGAVNQIPVAQADGMVTIPWPEFARLTQVPGMAITVSSGHITVTAPVQVPALNRTVDVVADGRVGLAGGKAALTVANIRVAGLSLPQPVVRLISDVINSQVQIPQLPYGLRLTSVRAADVGLQLSASAANVTISVP